MRIRKKQLKKKIEGDFQNGLGNLTTEYKNNLKKIIDNQGLSAEMLPIVKDLNIFKEEKLRTAGSFAKAAIGRWKGNLLEQCLAMCVAQLGKVQNVKVTGSNLDQFDKSIKSDVTFKVDDLNIGLSAKNYMMIKDGKDNFVFKYDLALHGGKDGTSFENFLERLESLKNDDFQNSIDTITKRFKTNNYYYNLINEAASKFSFKKSAPAEDFIAIVKGLAAAWFGTQLVTDTKEGSRGQSVDFLVIGKKGFVPMSVILRALQKETSGLKVNILSKTEIDEEKIYKQKIEALHGPRMYTGKELDIGIETGELIYEGIKVSPIKLNKIFKLF